MRGRGDPGLGKVRRVGVQVRGEGGHLPSGLSQAQGQPREGLPTPAREAQVPCLRLLPVLRKRWGLHMEGKRGMRAKGT